ncbi:MAG TPA: MmcQ/YjbR family DNA-binding protein [Thermoanaerobaculia bacterium]
MSKTRKTNADRILGFCRGLPGVTEDVKWGHDLCFLVGGKMFVVFDLPDCEHMSFKVDPVAFGTMVQKEGITPAPYLAHHSWVAVASRDVLPEDELKELIRQSYLLIAGKLPKKTRTQLGLT